MAMESKATKRPLELTERPWLGHPTQNTRRRELYFSAESTKGRAGAAVLRPVASRRISNSGSGAGGAGIWGGFPGGGAFDGGYHWFGPAL